ncbi:PAS domain S-box protein [Rubrobacter indicoceani]|uniref:PAS domain S-box protein n=1 Tax=Rubrobacter indicoceani TaxID=2051957 RepID=UPI0013C445C7|nr:PAS domain S-box protein [Rubrobacter indicoceani]
MSRGETRARLQALRRLGAVSSEADQALKEITDDARLVFGADLAMVNLMLRDTVYFRSWSGPLSEEAAALRVVRQEDAVCALVVDHGEVLVIEDLTSDSGSGKLPFCPVGDFRFYAGAPLITSRQETIGTLCVLRREPGKFSESDKATLRAFARAAVARMELISALEGEREARRRETRRSEELQDVLDRSLDVIVTVGFDGEIRAINRAAESVFGWSPEEVVGSKYLDHVHPKDFPEAVRAAKALYSGESVCNQVLRFLGRDGEVRWVEWNASPVPDQQLYYGVARNITDRKLAEEKARETEILYRALVERNPAVTYVRTMDEAGGSAALTYISPRIEDILGFSPEEWLGRPLFWTTRIHPEDRRRVLEEDRHTDATRDDFKIEYRSIARDGSVVWIYDEASLVYDKDGEPLYWLGAQYNITALKQTEEELRRAEEKYRSIFENIVEGVYQLDCEGRYITANPALARIFGYESPEALIRETPYQHEQLLMDPEQERALLQELREAGQASDCEVRARRRDGAVIWVSGSVQLMRSASGEVVGYEGSMEDITERKLLEEARRESEERFRQLFAQSVEALFIHDETGQIYDCNAEACRSLGYTREELLGSNVEQFIVLSQSARRKPEGSVWKRALSNNPHRRNDLFRNEHRRRDGTTFPVEVRLGSIDYGGRQLIFASVRDVTERKAYEDRLAHAASHDPLTNLPNRILFMENLEAVLTHARHTGSCTALLYLDLNGFKEVNDTYGHHVGDRLLVQVARRLESRLREDDIAARLGGDEFTILISDLSTPANADEVLRRVREIFLSPFNVQGWEVDNLGCSIGMVCTLSGAMSAEELLREADRMMYLEKKSSRHAPLSVRRASYSLKPR